MVPLTPDESRGCVHRSDGDRSCHGERPGTPPARGGHVAGQGFMPGRRSSRPKVSRLTLIKLGEYLSDQLVTWHTDAATMRITNSIHRILAEAGWGGAFSEKPRNDYGLRTILRQSSLVSSLAKLGLCNAFTVDRAEIETLLADAGHDLGALISACAEYEHSTGLRFLEYDEHTVRARI